MILEVAMLNIRPGDSADFERAFDEAQAQTIDEIEVGQRVNGPVRFALQVPDLQAALDRLLAHGATLVHSPVMTPWGDLNARVQDPDWLQITLFQVRAQAA